MSFAINALSNVVNYCFPKPASEPNKPVIKDIPKNQNDKNVPLETVRKTFKKGWFQTLAASVMAATAAALAAKGISKGEKDKKQ